jgi:hypothetical protein
MVAELGYGEVCGDKERRNRASRRSRQGHAIKALIFYCFGARGKGRCISQTKPTDEGNSKS